MRGILTAGAALSASIAGLLEFVTGRRRRCTSIAVSAKPLLSRPEQILYGRLVRAFPGHIVLSQVALSQLLVVDRARAFMQPRSADRQFRQMVADFVICKPDFSAAAVVELDDSTPQHRLPRKRDRRKDQFLKAAGIKVVRVPITDLPSEIALRALVATLPVTASTAHLMRRAS